MSVSSSTLRNLRGRLGRARDFAQLPPRVHAASLRDARGVPPEDPGIDACVRAGIGWLGRAQDMAVGHDGGVARHFSLRSGWSASYPETTGYIIPTFLACTSRLETPELEPRAKRMLDWLVSIQLPGGGFQGGLVDQEPRVPVTFNTGQILLGLASGTVRWSEYAPSMRKAADWLVETQDPDGCWRSHPSPFAETGEKVYDTHVAWGLIEAARVAKDTRYGEAALANVRWALTHQRDNGWFARCCLVDPAQPLTHTLGYALRGVLEAYDFEPDPSLLEAAVRCGDGLLGALGSDGLLPGRLDASWKAAASWACLTGSVQVAHCWLLLARHSGDTRYREAARVVNRFVRRTIRIKGDPDIRGGVKGSFPVQGGYGTYEYLNWAAKFMVDAQLLEQESAG